MAAEISYSPTPGQIAGASLLLTLIEPGGEVAELLKSYELPSPVLNAFVIATSAGAFGISLPPSKFAAIPCRAVGEAQLARG